MRAAADIGGWHGRKSAATDGNGKHSVTCDPASKERQETAQTALTGSSPTDRRRYPHGGQNHANDSFGTGLDEPSAKYHHDPASPAHRAGNVGRIHHHPISITRTSNEMPVCNPGLVLGCCSATIGALRHDRLLGPSEPSVDPAWTSRPTRPDRVRRRPRLADTVFCDGPSGRRAPTLNGR
jgi:hypothetical protein